MNQSFWTIDEIWAFAACYFPSLAVCVAAVLAVWLLPNFARRKHRETRRRAYQTRCYLLMLFPAIIWCAYFITTARDTFVITSLDSEDDSVAAGVYKALFDLNLNDVIKLATDKRQSGNVRFYASCRVADLLVAEGNDTRAGIYQRIKDAPSFRTSFFGTNQLTCGFFTPGYAEGPFTVSGIVAKRLRIIEGNEVNSNKLE